MQLSNWIRNNGIVEGLGPCLHTGIHGKNNLKFTKDKTLKAKTPERARQNHIISFSKLTPAAIIHINTNQLWTRTRGIKKAGLGHVALFLEPLTIGIAVIFWL